MDSKVRESIKINKKRKKLSLRRREKSKKREMEILLQNRQTRIYNDTVCLCVWTHVKRWQIVTNCQLINKNSAKRPPLLLQTFKGEKTKGNEKEENQSVLLRVSRVGDEVSDEEVKWGENERKNNNLLTVKAKLRTWM